ncbi:MAG TPA: GGDEF domain-containing protein, partial [Gemmatimonadaceae bacterium]|nr:GGDEF domain-containing protein [Gemmatimonadaceae bacterium]
MMTQGAARDSNPQPRISLTQLTLTTEMQAARPSLATALALDQAELQREVILWQRWVRYLGVLMLVLIALVFGAMPTGNELLPTMAVVGAYVVCVYVLAWRVQRSPGRLQRWLPGILVTADVLAISGVFYFGAATTVHYRMLVVGLLVVQLAVFYFGWRLGAYATLLAAAMYIVTDAVLPPYGAGAHAPLSTTALNVTVFVLACSLPLAVFGSFRRRMNRVRLFCKLIEEGELSGNLGLEDAARPDDVTLLARSFDKMRNRLAEQIGTDPLTGCLNRRALETRLRAEWRLAKRRGSTLAVVAIDLDHFKHINDSRGHPAGDLVLKQVSGIMMATARDSDAVARMGGDEFVILLPDTGGEGAYIFAERLRRRVDEFSFGSPTSPLPVTISVGVALTRG